MFDTTNRIQQLCSRGMILESEGYKDEAATIYNKAWEDAPDDLGKCIAAHYLAGVQDTPADRLDWYLKCLNHVVAVRHDEKRTWLTLILYNVGKGYEETGVRRDAKSYYQLARTYEQFVSEDEAGLRLCAALKEGLARVSAP